MPEVDSEVLSRASMVARLGRPTCDFSCGRRVGDTPDVSISLARVQQAEAISKQLRASFLPTLSLVGSINTQPADALGFGFGLDSLDDLFPSNPNAPVEEDDESSLFTSGSMALQAGLPLDIWGSGVANQQAAVLDAEASEMERVNGMRLLSTSIVNAYYDALALLAQYEIVENSSNRLKRCWI